MRLRFMVTESLNKKASKEKSNSFKNSNLNIWLTSLKPILMLMLNLKTEIWKNDPLLFLSLPRQSFLTSLQKREDSHLKSVEPWSNNWLKQLNSWTNKALLTEILSHKTFFLIKISISKFQILDCPHSLKETKKMVISHL